jgi:Mg2+ and Co2+ transporter CorA
MTIEQLDSFLLEDIQNPDHPSDFIPREGYDVLVLRLPEVKEHNIEIVSYAFVVEGDACYAYDRQKNTLVKIGSLVEMNAFLDEKTEKLIKEIKRYHYEIELLEESLYEENLSGDFMQKWLTYKKEVSLIQRLMFHAALSFELFVTHHKKYATKTFEELAYADLYEHMVRIRDLAQAAMDKLDNLYDFYRAKVDEKMNRNVYYLTLLSGIFLPLTLLTGFFGMNTGGLPLADDPNGTWKVVVISIILEIIFFMPFILQNMKKIRRFRR